MYELLSFYKERTNFKKLEFFYSAFTCLAIIIIIIFCHYFDIGIVETLVEADFTIFHLSIGY